MEELISVVIPVYNVEKYLDRCLDSVVNQTYKNLEILLIDDGSTDKSSKICDNWAIKDKRIKVIHKNNAGLGMARNTGIENATGNYICFFDSDDYVNVEILNKSYALIKKENADIVVFGLRHVDNHEKMLNAFVPNGEQKVFSGEEVQDVFLPDLINSCSEEAKLHGLSLSACVCLYDTKLLKSSNWRFVSEREILSEDSYSLIALYKHINKVVVLGEVGYYYCNNKTSLTHTYRDDRYEKIKDFYNKSVQLQQDLGYSIKVKERLARLFLAFCIEAMKQVVLSEITSSEQKEKLKNIILDETMRGVLTSLSYNCYSLPIKILFWAMRNKLYGMVYLLVKLQVNKK